MITGGTVLVTRRIKSTWDVRYRVSISLYQRVMRLTLQSVFKSLTNFDCLFSVLLYRRLVAWHCTGLPCLELVDDAVDDELHGSA